MLAKKLEIESILGVEKLVIEPGALTIIEGRNASGKTSILEAARAILRGGHDGSLVRKGAEEGRIRLTLADGTVFLKRVTKERSSLEVTEPQKGKISRAQAYVDSQVDELGIDPLAIITCQASRRAEYLAEAMPLKLDPAAFEGIVGRPPVAHELKNPLDAIAAAREAIYDERTGVNRTLKDKQATARQLRETLPVAAEVPADPGELRTKKTDLEVELTAVVNAATTKRQKAGDAIQAGLSAASKDDGEKLDAEIAKIRLETEERIEAVRAGGQKRAGEREKSARADVTTAYEVEKAEAGAARAAFQAPIAELAEKITKAEALAKEHQRAEKTREIITSSEKDAARADADSKALSHAIDELDALKVSLLEKLPIKGLEIRAGQVFVDDVPFERVNRARQIEIAVKVAQLRAGPLGLIVLDDTEHLDAESFKAFEAAAAGAGLQVLCARVSDSDLSVRTVEATSA